MRVVAVNTYVQRLLPQSGTATSIREIVAAIESLGIRVEERPGPAGRKITSGKTRNLLRMASWDLVTSGLRPADIMIYPANSGGIVCRAKMKLVVVHDTMVFDKTLEFDRGYRLYCQITWRPSLRNADVIVVPSVYSADSLKARWPSLSSRVSVVPWPSKWARVSSPPQRTHDPLQILTIGATEPHKRHMAAIEAVRLARLISGRDFRLKIIGGKGRAEQDLLNFRRIADPTGSWIQRIAGLTDDQLMHEVDGAYALLQPSAAEGYGLPVIESSARGLPVRHSGAGALGEIHPDGIVSEQTPLAYARSLICLLDPEAHRKAQLASLDIAGRFTTTAFRHRLASVMGIVE